jgi:hypothetical protein
MSPSRRQRRRRRQVLATAAVVAVFLVALIAWVGNPFGKGPSVPTTERGTATPDTSSSASPTTGAPSTSIIPAITSLSNGLPPLPLSTDINGADHGHHVVTVSSTSDQNILALVYYVRGGQPESASYTFLKSPMSVTTPGTGDGLIAEIGAQAGPDATQVTCTVSVDGKVTASNTAKGPYGVAFCVG